MNQKKKILLTGGGTGGATTPLLAIAETLQHQESSFEFHFVGTPDGPEKDLVQKLNIPFTSIKAAKLRRYCDIKHVQDFFRFPKSFIQATIFLLKYRPDVIVSVGSYVSIPFAIMGKFLQIPVLIHQQDLRKGLANKIMTPFASSITVTFHDSLHHFPRKKTAWTGNPIRTQIVNGNAQKARDFLKLDPKQKIILMMGGGTGAHALNTFIYEHINRLTKDAYVIHLTGKGKHQTIEHPKYHAFEFLHNEMGDMLALADVVVSRAGISSLTELSTLGKASIIIPIPGTHQEENAKFVARRHATFTLAQKEIHKLPRIIDSLINDRKKRSMYASAIKTLMPTQSNEKMIKKIIEVMK